MLRGLTKLTTIWFFLLFSLFQWVKAQDPVAPNYVSGSDCKSLVIPYFQTKYKECLSRNGSDECNQYVDFRFLEALQSACMAEGRGISKLKLSRDELFALFDEILITGTIDLDAGLDELERRDEIETSDEQVNVYPFSQDANNALSLHSQKPQAAVDPNTAIPDQTKDSLESVLHYVKESLEDWIPSFILGKQEDFDRGLVTDYKKFPPVFAVNTIISNAIATVPLTTAESISYELRAFLILVAAILYGTFLAIFCWIIFPVTFVALNGHGKMFNLTVASLAAYTVGNALKSLNQFVEIALNLARAGLWGIALLCVLLFTCYVILTMPVTNAIKFYEDHVYGGVDTETHDNIKEARSSWSSSARYKPLFSITRIDPYNYSFNKTEKRDANGYLLSSFEYLTIKMRIENDSPYPLIYGEFLCEVTFLSGESFSFVDYIAAKPEDIVNHYGEKEILIYDESMIALWSPELEEIMVRAQDIDNLEDRRKQLEVNCVPLASYHKRNMFEQKGQAVKALFDKEEETLTVVNNSDDHISHLSLECIVDDRPGPNEFPIQKRNDAGQVVREYYKVKPSYTREEFRVDGNEGYIPPGGKRIYDFSGSQYSPRDHKYASAREHSDLEHFFFSGPAINSLAFNLSKSTQCGIYDTTRAKKDGFFDKYWMPIIIFSFLGLVIFRRFH